MNSGLRVATGVAVGYLLGRTRKMRLALMIAAAGVTGARGGSPAVLLKRGISQLGSIPEVAEIAETAKHELLDAAKAATVAAAAKRVEAISGRMQDQIHGGSADEDTDENDDTDDTDENEETEETEDEPAPRRRRASARSGSGSGRSPVRRGRR
jgi:hypothetical protein